MNSEYIKAILIGAFQGLLRGLVIFLGVLIAMFLITEKPLLFIGIIALIITVANVRYSEGSNFIEKLKNGSKSSLLFLSIWAIFPIWGFSQMYAIETIGIIGYYLVSPLGVWLIFVFIDKIRNN